MSIDFNDLADKTANDNQLSNVKNDTISKLDQVLRRRNNISFRTIQRKFLRLPLTNSVHMTHSLPITIRNSHGEISEISVVKLIIDIIYEIERRDGYFTKFGDCILDLFGKGEAEKGTIYIDNKTEAFKRWELDLDRIMSFIKDLDLSFDDFKSILNNTLDPDKVLLEKIANFFNISIKFLENLKYNLNNNEEGIG